ncbi:MAG: SUF system NifU family Fe-S cluster assembly protein [bacterium]
MDKNELYQEVLLQYSKRPKNFGPMECATHTADGHNALCGDEISLALKIENDAVTDAKFTGSACAICTASASIMTSEVQGLSVKAVEKLASGFREMARTGSAPDLPQKIQILDRIHLFPQRVKCAVLPWETLLSAIEHKVEAK